MRYISILFLLSCFLLSTPLRAERVKVIVRQPIVPVLTKKEINPVLQLKLIKSCPGPCFVKEIGLSLKGTTLLTDLTHLSLYRVAGKRGLSDWEKCVDSVAPALKTVLDTPLELKSDTTILWVTVKLKDKVDLTHRVTVSCDHVTTTCGKASVTSVRPIVALRTGVAVRQRGEDGVHTSRIPGITTSLKGTLMAIFDARYDSSRDLQGDIDIAMMRSLDGGMSWQPMQIVLDRNIMESVMLVS